MKPAKGGEDLRVYAYELPEGIDRASNLEDELHYVTVTDIRTTSSPSHSKRMALSWRDWKYPRMLTGTMKKR